MRVQYQRDACTVALPAPEESHAPLEGGTRVLIYPVNTRLRVQGRPTLGLPTKRVATSLAPPHDNSQNHI